VAARNYRDGIEPLLRPALAAETLLAAAPLVKDPGVTEDVSISEELRNLLDPTILIGLGTHPGTLVQQAAFGRALVGSPESIAGRLFHAVDAVLAPTLAVTGAGLAIFNVDLEPRGKGLFQRWFGAADRVATLVHRVAGSEVLGVRPAPKGALRRGRILVAFTDGSGCALVCAPPSLMPPVVAAIGQLGQASR
jgi:hypothetical protein